MSAFLTGLLDRALDRAPVLERRRPSRFEPRRHGARDSLESPALLEEDTGEEESDSQAYAPTQHQHSEPAEFSAARHSATTREFPKQDLPAHVQRETGPQTRAEPVAVRVERIVESNGGAARLVERIVEREIAEPRALSTPARLPAETREVRSHQEPSGSLPGVERKARNTAQNNPPPPAPLNASKDGRAPFEPARVMLVPATVQPAPRPAKATAAPRAPGQNAGRSHEPTVHVTIGRVEIRATSSPTAENRAPRRSGPKLSLDDYLKARGGRR